MYTSSPEQPEISCRYYICDKKLAALGWKETTPWEVGLKKTIDWYLHHGFRGYWQGDVESALQPHPSSIPAKVGKLPLPPTRSVLAMIRAECTHTYARGHTPSPTPPPSPPSHKLARDLTGLTVPAICRESRHSIEMSLREAKYQINAARVKSFNHAACVENNWKVAQSRTCMLANAKARCQRVNCI